MQDAAERVINGEKARLVSQDEGIAYSTLRKYVSLIRSGHEIVKKRRWPPPVLTKEAEQWLYDWVVGMQCISIPCEPQDVIAKANAIIAKLDAPPVGTGWYKRFLERHPLLVMRQAQVVSRVRNEVDVGVVTRLFWTVAKIVVEQKLDPSRVFNVDETAFLTRKKSRRVLAVKGSPNVWCKSITTNFHLSLVACASAAGFVVPPLFVLPGERVNRTLLDECSIPDATITTTTSGFVKKNAALVASWLTWFAASVPATVRRPLVLIMDGYRCHYSVEMVETATKAGVILLSLPANATHLLQPLDVSVFSAFKKKISLGVKRLMLVQGVVNISKAQSVRIAAEAWETCNFAQNVEHGFAATGLYRRRLWRC
ncbi:hypothetical protein P43SY_003194 [Pythium insidiosum]|uniref:HTH CENPB-type domain-containing protein n=1 Tax=Pythium insidiosum TaxID=114742 RepID=A0AAD5Q9E8_PYTIN|nr:hypothetical protein P43SY_003194 [Pythium insidiosum]